MIFERVCSVKRMPHAAEDRVTESRAVLPDANRTAFHMLYIAVQCGNIPSPLI